MFDLAGLRRIKGPCCLGIMDSPVGRLSLIASDAGLHALMFDREREGCESGLGKFPVAQRHPVLLLAFQQLAEYFSGIRTSFDVPLAMEGTTFQKAAWKKLREIPYGSVTTYGAQARSLGRVQLARAIGAANSKNPVSIIVPCHRVVGVGGALTGFGGGLEAKAQLLAHENRVFNFMPTDAVGARRC
ncbi:methylated-DNA--[protein]-cysteine S-methyltransferase [Variovorax paradoxus]|uniref:methylated-DNA--[protein]-cysteine S-methyltransferase n=1 Tax=Variovorax paradoxus TaxID=34073 RepID=UPI000AD90E77|nr:methylated-DNA--[protein]-cysteine S-methyltransferase [Variovorax paradoxus]